MKPSYIRAFQNIFDSFSRSEKTLFYIACTVVAASTFSMIAKIDNTFSMEVPAKGGTLVEGTIGSAPFINPLLASSETDKDLTLLVFSGLLKSTPEGKLTTDLAQNYEISDDGKEYVFNLPDNRYFHDGRQVTAKDVEFTIKKAQDPIVKSPKRVNWEGVEVEILSDREIKFTLKQPFAHFLEYATIGILPKHLWENIDAGQFVASALNINAIGSGPYKISGISKNTSGTESIRLSHFKEYSLGTPFLKEIDFKFFPSEAQLIDAYENGLLDSLTAISPASVARIRNVSVIHHTKLPRLFGVFFNQNQNSLFINREIRAALNLDVNRKELVDTILRGYGEAIYSAFPMEKARSEVSSTTIKTSDLADFDGAIALLDKAGWKMGSDGIREKKIKKETIKFKFSLTTSDAPELKAAAELLVREWQKLGAQIDLKIYNAGDLNQAAIRPRKYDALLFGEIVALDLDLFAFWHSSQRNDPGLNIALYTNSKVDKMLEESRTVLNEAKRAEIITKITSEINHDIPAIFLYSPHLIYVTPKNLGGINLGKILVASERFLGVQNWYRERDNVWKVFR